MSDQTLDALINDFIAMVETSTLIFEEKFGARDIRRLWHTKAIKRRGRVTRGVKYELHGIGCRINLSTGTVDFDYGPNGEINGLDICHLYFFACERPSKYRKYCDKKNNRKRIRRIHRPKKNQENLLN